jgi:16S rRNA (uracil1498-N3)-methyltransferase
VITVLLPPDRLAAGEAEIDGDAYRHLFRARRLAVGDRLRAVDGRGGARWAEVAAVGRSVARIALAGPAPANEPAVALTLVVAALRRERASWLVEKATELGVAAIRLLDTERTARELGGGGLARLERVAAAALEQCHGARLPEIDGPHPWEALGDLLADAPAEARFVLDTATPDPGSDSTARGVLRPAAGRALLLVGPEGGWTDAERDELARLGCIPVSLGDRTLRIETAALAGAALLLARP